MRCQEMDNTRNFNSLSKYTNQCEYPQESLDKVEWTAHVRSCRDDPGGEFTVVSERGFRYIIRSESTFTLPVRMGVRTARST